MPIPVPFYWLVLYLVVNQYNFGCARLFENINPIVLKGSGLAF
jgi:hypothetical protein